MQHHYLAFVTLAFNTLVYLVFRNEEWLTGGIYGISNVPRPDVLGWSMGRPREFYYFCLAHLALVSLATWWLIRSPWGRAFVAVRENPMRALSLGVDTRRYTLMAFALGAGLGGISGALYAPLVQFVDPTPFALGLSLNLLLMVVVGGSGYFFGPVPRRDRGGAAAGMAALHARVLSDGLRLLVIVLMVFCPAGLLGLVDRLFKPRRQERDRADRSGCCDTTRGRAMTAILAVRDLSKRFGGIVAVDGVSFEVNEGEILGIIGPNGSGKSTLFNCILGQLRPTAGDVHLDGRPVTGMRAVRSQSARREPHVSAAAGLSAIDRAREPDPGGPGAQGHHALASHRPARRRARPRRRTGCSISSGSATWRTSPRVA